MPLFIKNPRPRPGDLLLFRADRFYFPAEDTNLALEFNIYVPEIVLALGTYESFKKQSEAKIRLYYDVEYQANQIQPRKSAHFLGEFARTKGWVVPEHLDHLYKLAGSVVGRLNLTDEHEVWQYLTQCARSLKHMERVSRYHSKD